MKIAYFSPFSPQKSGISDYSEKELLPHLSKYMEIDLYVDEGVVPDNPEITEKFNIFSYKKIDENIKNYGAVLYNVGNNPLHEYIYRTLIKYPGIVILHDIFLHGLISAITLSKGKKQEYIDEFKYCYGTKGEEIAKKAIKSGVYPDFEYPLIKRIIDHSTGVIVHSQYGKDLVFRESPDVKLRKINMPVSIQISDDHGDSIKKKYNIGSNTLVISSFGYIYNHKRIHVALNAFNRFLQFHPDSKFMLIGTHLAKYHYKKDLSILSESIIETGYVPTDELSDYLLIPDIFINLRYPTAGETSISVLKIMGTGKPVIVSNVGWFSELPDNCCAKVDVDNFEEEVLLEYLKVLASNRNLRKKMGENARELVLHEHDPEKIAEEFYYFISEIIEGNKSMIIEEVSNDMAEIGISENDISVIEAVAVVLKELGLYR